MKKFFLLGLVLLSQLSFTQEITEKALLWEISGKGLEKPSYLFGTIHIACKGEVNITPEIDRAFNATEKLMLEIDMDDPTGMMKLMGILMSADGVTVEQKLGEERAAKVNSFLKDKMGTSLDAVNGMSLQALLIQMTLAGLDCPNDPGYDIALLQKAMMLQKEVLGLESVDKQIEVLFSQTDEDAIQAMMHIVDHFDEVVKQTSDMVEAYKNSEVEKLYQITKEGFESEGSMGSDIKEFLDDRNIAWIPVIENQIHQTPTFIACGAAHLAGGNGVINLLKKQGYTLKAIQ